MILRHQRIIDKKNKRPNQHRKELARVQRMKELEEKYTLYFWVVIGAVIVLLIVLLLVLR